MADLLVVCANPGIPHKCHRKVTRHMHTTFLGLVARRRLSSSEGALEGVGEVC